MAGSNYQFKGRGVVQLTGRNDGKSHWTNVAIKRLMESLMDRPTKIIWHKLPGRKLKATWEVGPRGWENYGLKESDMDPIQQWCTQNRCGKRISFDTFIFKEEKHVTMFLLRWSS